MISCGVELQIKKWHQKCQKDILGQYQLQMDSTQQQIYHIIKHQAASEMDEGKSREAVRKLKKAIIIRLYQTVTNPRLISENDKEFPN